MRLGSWDAAFETVQRVLTAMDPTPVTAAFRGMRLGSWDAAFETVQRVLTAMDLHLPWTF